MTDVQSYDQYALVVNGNSSDLVPITQNESKMPETASMDSSDTPIKTAQQQANDAKPPGYPSGATQYRKPDPVPGDLTFAGDDPASWDPIINGVQITACIYRMSEPVAGMRCDIVPMLMFHYPALRMLGYDLTQFTLDLKAYNQDALREMQVILHSVYPPQPQSGNKVTRPYVSKIQHPGLGQRGLCYFVPTKPSTSAIWYDHENQCHAIKLTLLQWSKFAMRALKPINFNLENGAVKAPPETGVGSKLADYGFVYNG
jgi:hypothetical protein